MLNMKAGTKCEVGNGFNKSYRELHLSIVSHVCNLSHDWS